MRDKVKTSFEVYKHYRQWCESIGVPPATLEAWSITNHSLLTDELERNRKEGFLASLHPNGANIAGFKNVGFRPNSEDRGQ